jgi:hypothetical protein
MNITEHEIISAKARDLILQGDILSLLRVLEEVCHKANIDVNPRDLFHSYRRETWARKLIELEDCDPKLAATLQERIDAVLKQIDENN